MDLVRVGVDLGLDYACWILISIQMRWIMVGLSSDV